MVDLAKIEDYKAATTPAKIPRLEKKELHKYLDYFSELREQFLPRGDKRYDIANERVEALMAEIRVRRGNVQHRLTQILAATSVLVGVLFGVIQCRANRHSPTPLLIQADIQPSTSPAPQNTPSPTTPSPTLAPAPAIEPTARQSQSPLLSPTPAP
jgi:hypothetical protein